MTSRRIQASLSAIAFGFLIIVGMAAEALAADLKTIRMQTYAGSIDNIPLWVAEEKGFYKKHGLAVKLVPIASGPLGLQALTAGSIDVSRGATEATITAASRGAAVQLIMDLTPNNIFTLEARSDLPLPHRKAGYPEVMKDLKGLKIGVTARGAATEAAVRSMLEFANMSATDVIFVAVGQNGLQALTAKSVDAAIHSDPFQTLCELQKTCVPIVDLRKGEGPPELSQLNGAYNSFTASKSYISTHQAEVDALIAAMSEAIEWAQAPSNFEEVLKIVSQHLTLTLAPDPASALRTLVKNNLPTFGTKIDRKAVKAFSDYLLKYKLIETGVDANEVTYSKAP